VPVSFQLDPEQDVVWIKAGDAEALLEEGEFSDWLQCASTRCRWA
jgi:hypothetical protein